MLLAIDMGNTNIVFGVFEGQTLKGHWRISTSKIRTSDETAILMINLMASGGIRREGITDIIISSVVPSLDSTLYRLSVDYFGLSPYLVRPGHDTYLPIAYRKPEEVGADRIVNAVAVRHLYGTPAIIIDFGTAITFCVLSPAGEYLGGSIFPGIHISASALFEATEKLIPVEIEKPGEVIGTTTKEALQSGFFWGFSSMVEGMVEKITKHLPDVPIVIATGGGASLLKGNCPCITIFDEHLTLKGLSFIDQERKSKQTGQRL